MGPLRHSPSSQGGKVVTVRGWGDWGKTVSSDELCVGALTGL